MLRYASFDEEAHLVHYGTVGPALPVPRCMVTER
eukprot:SAG31_NODE_6923_length_1848_cov_21.989708_1_plen_33_part_10